MEYIVALYRLRHFAKAAEQCGVPPSMLTYNNTEQRI